MHSPRRIRLLLWVATLSLIGSEAQAQAATPGRSPEPSRSVSLEEALALALQSDPVAVASETALTNARADRLAASGQWLPSLTLTSGYSKSSVTRTNRLTGLPSSESYSTGAQANLVLFAGGERIEQGRAATARVLASEADLRSQTFATMLGTTDAFYEAVASRSLSAVAAQRRERAGQQLDFARTRLEVGTATTSDVLRAEMEVGNADLAVLEADAEYRDATLNLGRWIGADGAVEPALASLPDHTPALPDRQDLIDEGLRSSPLVEATDSRLRGTGGSACRVLGLSAGDRVHRGLRDWASTEFPPGRQDLELQHLGQPPGLRSLPAGGAPAAGRCGGPTREGASPGCADRGSGRGRVGRPGDRVGAAARGDLRTGAGARAGGSPRAGRALSGGSRDDPGPADLAGGARRSGDRSRSGAPESRTALARLEAVLGKKIEEIGR
ncbi:MAG: TolC family protein [Candidatus Eisenbacteria bacterium]